ncbi:TonB-dependent receptor [Maribellus comscasis]|nr:TonB-dependent receptor [Maribellus comscasis]
MKLTAFLIMLSIGCAFAGKTYSQSNLLNLKMDSKTIREVLSEIEAQSEYHFMYSGKMINVNRKVSVDLENQNIEGVLHSLFSGTDINYIIKDRFIVLSNLEEDEFLSGSQQKNITGKVSSKDGEPLPGVTVVVKGTSKGTVTNADGNYSLNNVPENATLSFSFVGLIAQEILVEGRTNIDVIMEEDAIGIEEVVAIGYGTQKKRDVIGSIASVKSEVLEQSSGVSNFTSLLQGQAAGASVQVSSGRLGAGVDVKVRGLSSISAGTSPLWIVDGVPIITSASTGASSTSELSPFALINQADIESIEVLKDAAATSIYGSRGSNGVIIVTTKTGQKGKISVNLDYSTGFSDLPFQQVELVNTKQWFEMKDDMKNSYGLGDYTMADFYNNSPYLTEELTREQAEAIDIDWLETGLRQGSFQNYNLSVVGGGEKTSFFMSANYRKDKGVVLNDDLERYGLRINLDAEPSRYFKAGAKFNFTLSNSSRGKNDDNSSNGNKSGVAGGFAFINTESTPFTPVYSLENPNEYYNPYLGNAVMYADRDYLVQDVEMYRGLASIYGEFAFPFLKELAVRTELSVDFVQANRNTWISEAIRWDGSLGDDAARTSRTLNYNVFLKYDKIYGDHSINAVGGIEAQRSVGWWRTMSGQNLVGSYKQLGSPSNMISMFSGLSGETYLLAYFGRANYKYRDKYLAGVSIRRDASAVFTPDYRWGTFVAFSAGWILSDEGFMGEFGENNFLKLRGSFGQTGNANIPLGLDVSKYSTGLVYGNQELIATNGTAISGIGVSNLTWETTNNLDVGLDFGFKNNRINGSLAYYNKYVNDLLLATQLPYSSGISSIYGNIGDLVNSGVEFNISSVNLKTDNFQWQTNFNISFNHNEVKKLVPRVDEAGTGMVSGNTITKVGYPVRDWYLSDFAGIDSQTGLPQLYALDHDYYDETGETRRLKDENGEDVIILANNANGNSNKFHHKNKSAIPTYYGGFTNRFTYKGFDFSFLITFSGGNYIYDQYMRDMYVDIGYGGQQTIDLYENYWRKPGDEAKYQRMNWRGNLILEDGTTVGLGDPRIPTTQWLFKGDYVKLKSISLGYTVPKTPTTAKIFQDMRVYTTLENLYTLTDYPGWDPEGRGSGDWDLPQLFSVTFGVSVKF